MSYESSRKMGNYSVHRTLYWMELAINPHSLIPTKELVESYDNYYHNSWPLQLIGMVVEKHEYMLGQLCSTLRS